ncbi:unnamed protein product, partial [Cuscuta epithymum]
MQVVFPAAENSQSLPSKCPVPSPAASSSSSRLGPTAHELLAMATRKKRAPTKLTGVPPKFPKHSESAVKDPDLVLPKSEAAASSKFQNLNLSFSPNFCSLKDGLSMKNEMSQLLLPSTPDLFNGLPPAGVLAVSSAYAFQSVQASLAAAERVAVLEKTLDELRRKETTLLSQLKENAQQIRGLINESSMQAAQNLKLSKRVQVLEAYGRRKRQEVTDAACYYVWKTRGELMKSFLAGETSNWEAEKDV